MLRIKILS